MDLYRASGQRPNCYDPDTKISVMGNNPNARVFDDEINRCPNEAAIELVEEYIPTWTSLIERFPEIPPRTGPAVPGPRGSGPSFDFVSLAGPAARARTAFPAPVGVSVADWTSWTLQRTLCGPAPDGLASAYGILCGDAGSGRDAGGSRDDAVPVAPGQAYEGASPGPSDVDYDSFQVGQENQINIEFAWTTFVEVSLIDAHGEKGRVQGAFGAGPLRATHTIEAMPDTWYLEVLSTGPGTYGFGIGLDEAPPPAEPHVTMAEALGAIAR